MRNNPPTLPVFCFSDYARDDYRSRFYSAGIDPGPYDPGHPDPESNLPLHFLNYWDAYGKPGYDKKLYRVPLPETFAESVIMFWRKGLDLDELHEFVRISMEATVPSDEKFRYFCGCCWRTLQRVNDTVPVDEYDGGGSRGA